MPYAETNKQIHDIAARKLELQKEMDSLQAKKQELAAQLILERQNEETEAVVNSAAEAEKARMVAQSAAEKVNNLLKEPGEMVDALKEATAKAKVILEELKGAK